MYDLRTGHHHPLFRKPILKVFQYDFYNKSSSQFERLLNRSYCIDPFAAAYLLYIMLMDFM